jgi:histone demethylase JARID1
MSFSLLPTGANMHINKRFSTKQQQLHRLQEGVSFGDGIEYNPIEYQKMASKFTKEYKANNYPEHELVCQDTNADDEAKRKVFSATNLEKDYWSIVETRSREISVEYGNDINTDEFGSGFPLSERGRSVFGTKDPGKIKQPEPKFGTRDYYKESWWNLNNMPWAPDSVLRHVKVAINGINVPWMYYGSLFTTFCWHNEDNYLYSVNYHHAGAPKQWYGVPGTKKDADGLEKVFKSYLSMKMRDMPDLLHHITTMFSPRLLQNAEVPIYKLLQCEGEFVVTFPRAFHGGFSMGPNIGEAVNFATHDWIAHGSDANERYRVSQYMLPMKSQSCFFVYNVLFTMFCLRCLTFFFL